jgi:hypothetical protein
MKIFKSTSARFAVLPATLSLGLLSCPLALAAADAPAATGTATAAAGSGAQWHEQTMKFTYDGITTLYTCDGLEDKVRVILLEFGARKDVKVRATGCERGSNLPSRFAWVEANYSYLVPGSDAPAANQAPDKGTVKSSWSTIEIAPNRPHFMGAGECELIEQMRDALSKGFTLRNVQYRTSCTPHQLSLGAYAVTAEVLKADPHAE